MTYIPRNKVTDLIPNKFQAIKVAALEARRLNERAHTFSVSLPGKITTLAVDRLIDGKVEYFDAKERAREARLEMELAAEAAKEAEEEEAVEEE
ncbi:MAG: DNA-directed RNA polymerase subunit omega [bacterium]|nr:DNA-directed RNA polymerase subunit omega [bacterium]